MNTSALAQVSPLRLLPKRSRLCSLATARWLRLQERSASRLPWLPPWLSRTSRPARSKVRKLELLACEKKAAEFSSGNYLANWVQSLFLALPGEEVSGSTMVLGGDGRWFNKEAAQIIIKLAAGNGVGKMYVGQNGYLATPAASAVIRARKAYGGFIMSASLARWADGDWGIKFNYSSGEPA